MAATLSFIGYVYEVMVGVQHFCLWIQILNVAGHGVCSGSNTL